MQVTWAYQVQFEDGNHETKTLKAETKAEAIEKIHLKYAPKKVKIVNIGCRG